MNTVRSFAHGRLESRRTLAVIVLVAAAFAVFAGHAHGAAQFSQSWGKAASGTLAITDRAILFSYRDGEDLVQERLVHRQLSGTFAGSEVSVVRYAFHPDGSATITATTSCGCTVEGRKGTVTFVDEGTASAAGVLSVSRTTIDADGGLAGLRAELKITGNVKEPTQTYAGQYAFGGD